MLIKKRSGIEIPSSEITPEHLYRSRRNFIKGAAAFAAGGLLAACAPPGAGSNDRQGLVIHADRVTPVNTTEPGTSLTAGLERRVEPIEAPGQVVATADELGDPLNPFEEVSGHNNYYEFTIDKAGVAGMAADYPTTPWQVEVGGLVQNPGVYDIDYFRTQFDQEERVYRMRCVEAWSMVIPWMGFPLHKFLDVVEPTSEARYVRFETIYDPENMPGQSSPWFDWPYIEGLRLDEARHDLTLLSTGLYGAHLLPQNGAPLRLVVPWKYGFKSIKSIVKIDLVADMPSSLWMIAAPNEYGFYANVNPEVDHPRWSQATERRIGALGRRPTLMFNGYEEQVAHLYAGMDLRQNF